MSPPSGPAGRRGVVNPADDDDTEWARKINIMACMHMPLHQASHQQQYTPDANYADAPIGGQLSDIDEHGGEQQLRQVGSVVSGTSAQSGDYGEGQEIAAGELS